MKSSRYCALNPIARAHRYRRLRWNPPTRPSRSTRRKSSTRPFPAQAHGARPLIGELRYAGDRRCSHRHASAIDLEMSFRQHRLVVGKLPGELARRQQAAAPRGRIAWTHPWRSRWSRHRESEQRLQFVHRLLRNQRFHLARNAFKLFSRPLHVRQSMSVGRNHGDRLRLQHHQRAIQRVARLFAGDGEARLRNHRPQYLPRES